MKVVNLYMVFKTARLDEITKEVSTNRKRKKGSRLSPPDSTTE